MLPVVCIPQRPSAGLIGAIAMPDGARHRPDCPGRAVWIYEAAGPAIVRQAIIPLDEAFALEEVLRDPPLAAFFGLGRDRAEQLADAIGMACAAFIAGDALAEDEGTPPA